MMRAALGLALAAALVPIPADALTLEEILEKHIAARGGKEAWTKVQTLTLKGDYTAFSEVGPFTLHLQRPNRIFIDHQYGRKRALRGFDGSEGWWRNPFFHVDWAQPMPATDTTLTTVESHFVNPLFEADARGHQVELVGEADFDGEDTYQLKVTLTDGVEEHWYLSRSTFLEFARTYTASDFGNPLPGRRYFADFRQVGDLVIPHLVEDEFGTRHRVMEVRSAEINPDLSGVRFAMPIPEGMDRLASLAGDWDVTVSLSPFPGTPRLDLPGTSTIQARFGGGLLEEDLTYSLQGITKISRWALSYDRFAKVYRLLTYNNTAFHPAVSEGKFGEDGQALTLMNQHPWRQREQLQLDRWTIAEISEDGFTVLEETSTDEGETWQEGARLVYRRKG